MTTDIHDEWVEKASYAMDACGARRATRLTSHQDRWVMYEDFCRAILTAVADDIRAQAWDEGAKAAGGYGHEDGWTPDCNPFLDNPYRGIDDPRARHEFGADCQQACCEPDLRARAGEVGE